MFKKTEQIMGFIMDEFLNDYDKEKRDTSSKLEELKQNSESKKEIDRIKQQFSNR